MTVTYNNGTVRTNIHEECVERIKMLNPSEHPNVQVKSIETTVRDRSKVCSVCGSTTPNPTFY